MFTFVLGLFVVASFQNAVSQHFALQPYAHFGFDFPHCQSDAPSCQSQPTWLLINKKTGEFYQFTGKDSLTMIREEVWVWGQGKPTFVFSQKSSTPVPQHNPLKTFEQYGLLGIVKDDNILISPFFEEIILKDNYFIFKENATWGVANYEGKELFYGLQQSPVPVGQGLVFEKDKKKGLINSFGQLLLKPVADSITLCQNTDFVKVFQDKRFCFIYLKSKQLQNFVAYDFEPFDQPDEAGLLRFYQNGKMGAALWNGQKSIFPNYAELLPTQNNLMIFRLKELFGVMTTSEQITIQPAFEKIGVFANEVAPAKQSGNWGLINSKGEWLLKNEYQDISPTAAGNWIVGYSDLYGFWQGDLKGGIPPVYERLIDLNWGKVLAYRNGRYSLKNYKNETLADDLSLLEEKEEYILLMKN